MTFSPRGSAAGGSNVHAFGLPLRSKAATEAVEPDLVLPPGDLPPLRWGVTEAHYSKWFVEETNKEVADQCREDRDSHKQMRKQLVDKFIIDQHRKVEDSHHQMAAAAAAVDTVRQQKLNVGQEMRVQLNELKSSIQLEKQVWSARGRELVEHAKHVQTKSVLERQVSQRGERKDAGDAARKERERLEKAHESNKEKNEEAKRQIVQRVREETKRETVGLSRNKLNAEKASIGVHCRQMEEANVEARAAHRDTFLSSSAQARAQVEAIKSGAKSARDGLKSARQQAADEVRHKRQAELMRKKQQAEAAAARNKQLHDLLYTNKFAPRSRAAKVELPGRIGKNPFNKDNGDALSPDLAGGGMAPAAADPMMGGMGGMGGPGRRGANLADEWDG